MSTDIPQIEHDDMSAGCPKCTIKHLQAAMAYMPTGQRGSVTPRSSVTLARAFINFAEAAHGYTNHHDLALGLLAHAEEDLLIEGQLDVAAEVRALRREIVSHSLKPEAAARAVASTQRLDMVTGHLAEAYREAPKAYIKDPSLYLTVTNADELMSLIHEIETVFFTSEGEPYVSTPNS